jgi:16S rRNA C967 or C1407 C5-methylase (RsmB/RsmF family)
MEPLRFDRILADVPCSGDGTLRKAPDIWRRWTVANGNGLHLLQLRIALKGCKLLKVGPQPLLTHEGGALGMTMSC